VETSVTVPIAVIESRLTHGELEWKNLDDCELYALVPEVIARAELENQEVLVHQMQIYCGADGRLPDAFDVR
jgi:hypothetical protein